MPLLTLQGLRDIMAIKEITDVLLFTGSNETTVLDDQQANGPFQRLGRLSAKWLGFPSPDSEAPFADQQVVLEQDETQILTGIGTGAN